MRGDDGARATTRRYQGKRVREMARYLCGRLESCMYFYLWRLQWREAAAAGQQLAAAVTQATGCSHTHAARGGQAAVHNSSSVVTVFQPKVSTHAQRPAPSSEQKKHLTAQATRRRGVCVCVYSSPYHMSHSSSFGVASFFQTKIHYCIDAKQAFRCAQHT